MRPFAVRLVLTMILVFVLLALASPVLAQSGEPPSAPDQNVQWLVLLLASLLVSPVIELVNRLGGFEDVHALFAAYVIASLVGILGALLTGLVTVTLPPTDPIIFVQQVLTAAAAVNGISQLVFQVWFKKRPSTNPETLSVTPLQT